MKPPEVLTTDAEDASSNGEEERGVSGRSVELLQQLHEKHATGLEVTGQQKEIHEQSCSIPNPSWESYQHERNAVYTSIVYSAIPESASDVVSGKACVFIIRRFI